VGAAALAVNLCLNYSIAGFNDWFLPTLSEFTKALNNIGPTGKLPVSNITTSDYYWCSNKSAIICTPNWINGNIGVNSANPTSNNISGFPLKVRAFRYF
jgi:hypothetical protein